MLPKLTDHPIAGHVDHAVGCHPEGPFSPAFEIAHVALRTASRSRCDEMTQRCRDLHPADEQHTREVEPEGVVVGVGVLERLTDAVAEFGVVQSLNPPTEGTVAHVATEHCLERGVLRQTTCVVEQVSDRDGGRCRLIAHAIARLPLTYFTFRRRNGRSR